MSKRFYSIEDVFLHAREGNVKSLNEALNYSIDNTTYWHLHRGYYAIHAAASKGKNECINLLLSRGVDIESSTQYGTALNVAAQLGKFDTTKMLIEKGANVDSKNSDGLTGLILASIKGNISCVDLLIKSGAFVDAKANNGCTALIGAIRCRFGTDVNFTEIVRLLLAAGADLELVHNSYIWRSNSFVFGGHTALELACAWSKKEIVTLLLDSGAFIKDNVQSYSPYQMSQGDCRPLVELAKEHRLRRTLFDSFVIHHIEYPPLIDNIYSTCFPSGTSRFTVPPVGWLRADAVRNKYYLDEVFFYLHLHVAAVHTKKLSSSAVASNLSSGFTELACNSDDTSTVMALLADRLKLYLV